MRGLIAGALLLAGLVACGAARAACQVDAKPVDFAVIDPTRENKAVGEVIVRCDDETIVEVAIGGGRAMQGPGDSELLYELFQDSGHSRLWGDGSSLGQSRFGKPEEDGSVTMTIYGLMPPQPGTYPGDYTDQVEITVMF